MPISLTATLAGAYRFVWANRADLVAYAFLPGLLVALARTLVLWLSGDWQVPFGGSGAGPMPDAGIPGPGENGSPAPPAIATADIVNAFITLIAYVMFAVAWHRRQLVAGETATVGAALRWGRRQWTFLGRLLVLMLGLGVLTFLLTLPFRHMIAGDAGVAPLFLFALMVVVGLLYGRVLLIFPAAAVDDPLGFRRSFTLTRGSSWRMLGIAVLPPLPLMVAGALVVSLLLGLASATVGPAISALLVLTLIEQAFAFAGIAVGVSALSIAYAELTGRTAAT